MPFRDHLQFVRDRYVTFYRGKIAEMRRAHPECVVELMIQPNGAQNPPPYSLLRVDAIYGSAEDPTVFRLAYDLTPAPRVSECECGSVRIHLGPLSWETASVTFESQNFDLGRLKGWLSKWIDDSELRQADDLGLAGVLHSIAWTSSTGGLWVITIDFGSAPVECAVELVDALAEQGITSFYLASNETDS